MKFQIGAMSVGDILDRGLKVLFSRLPTFYAISLVTLAPLLALRLALPSVMTGQLANGGDPTQQLAALAGGGLLLLALLIILQPIGTAATLHVVSQEFVDRPVTLGDAFRFAFSRFGSLLLASIMAGLIIVLGMILCLVPGIIFWTWYVFVGQVVVVEGLKADRALSRSKALTEGYRMRVLGVGLLVAFLIPWVFGIGVGLLGQLLPSVEQIPSRIGDRIVTVPKLNYRNYAVNTGIEFLLNILAQSYAAVCWTLFYFDLRIRKEGYDLELAAQQPPAVEIVE
jgi:hypothetical protein